MTFKAENQTLSGVIEVDSISTLDMTLSAGSVFTGMINITENAQGGSAVSNNAVVTVESGAVWNLTGDCTLTSLTNNGTINFNGHTVTLCRRNRSFGIKEGINKHFDPRGRQILPRGLFCNFLLKWVK